MLRSAYAGKISHLSAIAISQFSLAFVFRQWDSFIVARHLVIAIRHRIRRTSVPAKPDLSGRWACRGRSTRGAVRKRQGRLLSLAGGHGQLLGLSGVLSNLFEFLTLFGSRGSLLGLEGLSKAFAGFLGVLFGLLDGVLSNLLEFFTLLCGGG